MANITAAMVKELREMTNVGMMECKKALTEAEGDMDKAVDILRTRGLAAAAKKAGRATNEGTIAIALNDDQTEAAVLEFNCETDFAGSNEKFRAYANTICQAILANKPADVEALKASAWEGGTVQDVLNDAIHVIGENMQIARFVVLESSDGFIQSYIHSNGKLGILVVFAIDNKAAAKNDEFVQMTKDIAMQVAAMNPVSVSREDVPAAIVEHEMEIYKAQAAESGKPENIQEKMAEGRINKYYKEHCLLEEPFVKDGDKTVQQLVNEVAKACGANISIKSFTRVQLGEGEE